MTVTLYGDTSSQRAIIQYWDNDEVPSEVAELLASVRDLNPDLGHRLFHRADAEEFISANFSSREVAAFGACAVPAMQADYFRYCFAVARGGIWIDADSLCELPLTPLLELSDECLLAGPPSWNVPGRNDFLAFKYPGHPLSHLLLELATANIEGRIMEKVGFVTGPWLLAGLGRVAQQGSFDAVRSDLPNAKAERLLDAMIQAIGDHERVVEAFKGVRVIPSDLLAKWLVPQGHLAYKRTSAHWTRWQEEGRSIFT